MKSWHFKEITFGNEQWEINTARSIYHRDTGALIIADFHLGKAAHFRNNGLQMPNVLHQQDIEQLNNLLQHFSPKSLIIVGDIIHANANREWEDFHTLRNKHKDTQFILLKGNHDRKAAAWAGTLGLDKVLDSYDINAIKLQHEAPSNPSQHYMVGHLHPGVRVQMPFKKNMRFPSFTIHKDVLYLPAFCSFTGLATEVLKKPILHHAFHPDGFFEVLR